MLTSEEIEDLKIVVEATIKERGDDIGAVYKDVVKLLATIDELKGDKAALVEGMKEVKKATVGIAPSIYRIATIASTLISEHGGK